VALDSYSNKSMVEDEASKSRINVNI